MARYEELIVGENKAQTAATPEGTEQQLEDNQPRVRGTPELDGKLRKHNYLRDFENYPAALRNAAGRIPTSL
jgi:hypothetical protein